MNSRTVRFVSVFTCCVWPVVPHAAFAAKPSEKPSPEPPAVLRVLRAEVAGSVDRRAALQETLDSTSESATARWQAGFVKDAQSWRSFDGAEADAAEQGDLDEYLRRRALAPQTAEGQLELANWCRRQGWPDRERAHLGAVLSLDREGNHADVLARLGYRQIAGVWLSREQLLEWQQLNRTAQASLKKWGPKLEAIARQVSGGSRQRAAGLDALKKIDQTGAVPAIEYTLCGKDEATALLAVEALGRIAGFESSTALAKQAVFSPWAAVREAAVDRLKPRRLYDFVPQLVSLLSTPVRSTLQFYETPVNVTGPGCVQLFYSYILSRETENQFQVASFQSVNFRINRFVAGEIIGAVHFHSNRGNNSLDVGLAAGRAVTYLEIEDELQNRERIVLAANERISLANERIGVVLGSISGQPASPDAQVWWKWWSQMSGIEHSKQVVQIVENETVGTPAPFLILSCFAAGVPVWTETGARPIEEIKVGDLVLSKDVESGELTYKPVLQTTTRSPRELVTLRLNNETIACTGGHRFWQSGQGWVQARDLSGATLVHTATGNTPVWSTRAGDAQATYNLVVADFHTYFVGQHAVLCQDLLPPKPTNRIVPGFDRSQLVAERR